MIQKKLDHIIREIADFPKVGVNFKDITPVLIDPVLSSDIVDEFITRLDTIKLDAIVGIESRGFLYGFMLANKMGLPFIPIRKGGKLPRNTLKVKYDLEYGSSEVEIHKDDIRKDANILIHDDLLATGGTAVAAAELVTQLGGNVAAFAFIVNLDFLNGKSKLKKYTDNIINLINY